MQYYVNTMDPHGVRNICERPIYVTHKVLRILVYSHRYIFYVNFALWNPSIFAIQLRKYLVFNIIIKY